MKTVSTLSGEEVHVYVEASIPAKLVLESDGEDSEGAVPVLDSEGKLDVSVLPDTYQQITFPAGEAIPSGLLVAVIDGYAYKADCTNILHLYAIVGISMIGVSAFETVIVSKDPQVELSGWGLPSAHTILRCGKQGQLVNVPPNDALFNLIVGVVQSADKLNFHIQNYIIIEP
ncbi:hypothetical protein DYBT9275_02788 [Dyadobacter sp. CECT 9275]|uniref:Uncharacterized protein n=1 Tax=Dyadobacter helix TaxID=2822344 RepID=A0A916JCU4_9BACT|nr:hypothetical protein [Dyadobacter sp. CECT 9275]CAG5002024.1 hypothetical protein DYBT9275_02788 [Dyadobacter sp. CECT 9275]